MRLQLNSHTMDSQNFTVVWLLVLILFLSFYLLVLIGLADEELCVFFRNNHFNTLYKHNGELYILVTDQGYAQEAIVWEKLNQVR